MSTMTRAAHGLLLALAACIAPAQAQDDAVVRKVLALDWRQAPSAGEIAGKATVRLDGGLRFLGAAATGEFMRLTGNLPRADSYTLAARDLGWFAVFDFVDEGYVKDDEKIDAEAFLKVLKDANRRGDEERRKRGLDTLTIEGWAIAPRYDADNRRLEWATLLRNGSGGQTVNYSTKVLGRRGHMSAILVTDPGAMAGDIAAFKAALKGFDYVAGERYSEWRQGDKVAAYGLGALIIGGAAAVATKQGFWGAVAGLLAASWKLVAGLGIALLAGFASVFRRKAQ